MSGRRVTKTNILKEVTDPEWSFSEYYDPGIIHFPPLESYEDGRPPRGGMLVDFLNLEIDQVDLDQYFITKKVFDSRRRRKVSIKELRSGVRGYEGDVVDVLSSIGKNWKEQAKTLQCSIKQETEAILGASGKSVCQLHVKLPEPKPTVYKALTNLLSAVNRISFKSELVPRPSPNGFTSMEEFQQYIDDERKFNMSRTATFPKRLDWMIINDDSFQGMNIGTKTFATKERIHLDAPLDFFFWLLREAIRSGEFFKIKKCPNCGQLFIQSKIYNKRIFCSERCKVQYYNEKHKREKYVQNLRRQKRSLKLKLATNLLRQEKPYCVIEEKTGLSQRIIRKHLGEIWN